MGNLIWHEYARFVAITATVCESHACQIRLHLMDHFLRINLRRHLGWILGPNLPQILLGLHRRHFAWSRRYPVRHFLHPWFQTLRNHFLFTVFVKTRPSVGATPFVAVIVKIPLLQIVAMTLGFFILALEWPLPLMKKLPIYRNLVVRIVILFFQMFINILYYQVSSRGNRKYKPLANVASFRGQIALFGQ